MLLDEVRKAVQPELEQDFDALYEEFVAEHGEDDLVEFLIHLHDFGLISEDLVRRLASEGVLAPAAEEAAPPAPVRPIEWDDGPDGDGEATVLARADDLIRMTEQAAAARGPERDAPTLARQTDPPRTADPEPPPPEPRIDAATQRSAPGRAAQPANTPTAPGNRILGGLGLLPDFGDQDDDQGSSQKRTMFRKKNGQWQETDAFARVGGELEPVEPPADAPEKPVRQVRRNPAPKRVITRDEQRYTFLEAVVGEGAMGKVVLAQDNVLKRRIAYKEMSREIAEQPALASKFSAEAQITAQLEHPNIVPVYALEGDVAYTMKLVRGRTVDDLIKETRQILKKGAPLDEDHTLEARLDLFLKVCDAIAYAHARGVVHRDLKPENIMVGEFGEVYVMDWGIAKLLPGVADGPQIQDMEDEGELIIGTAGYMSPEQADARNDELTGASDQYALGLILHELVSLRPAVTGKNAVHILTRQQLGEVDRLAPFGRERIPPELAAIIGRTTQVKPERRYRSVDELADDVRRFLRGEAVRAKPDNPWQALVRFTGRHRQATLLAVMMVLFASVTLVMAIGIYTQVAVSRAAAREQALSGLVTSVSRHASHLDGQFNRLEGLLLLIASTAEDMLTLGDGVGRTVTLHTDFAPGGLAPPDTTRAPTYGIEVSPQHSAFVLAADTPPDAQYLLLPRLLPMNRHYQKVLLRSHSDEAASYTPKRAQRAITDVGLPVAWTWVALENGAYNVFPGHGPYPAGFDPRTRPWYAAAVASTGPAWGAPTADEDGGTVGLVVPCTTALRGTEGELLGVAGIDVKFQHLATELRALEGLTAAGGSAWVLDADGKTLIDPAGSPAGPPPIADAPEALAGIKAKRSGYAEVGSEIVVYTRMASLDWYYVVRGPTEALLSGIR